MKSVQHSDLKRVKQIAMNGYYSVLTIIDLFVLSFMGLLTRLSESLNKKQKRGFFLAFALIAGISVMEIVTLAVDGAPAKYRWLNIASNFLGFGLSPAVAICLVYVQDRKSAPRQNLRFAVGCEIAYLLFLAFSIPFGTVFSVSADNVYSRGTHFHIYIAVYFAAIFYLSLATILTARAFQNRSRALIYPLIVFLTAETIVQVALPDLHVTWLCVTLLAVLYYIYCTEMWNQLDALTGLLNQSSYLHRTAEMTRRGGMLVVFDVDHFKHINDRYGHTIGDEVIRFVADTIRTKVDDRGGFAGRFGGDEFVLCFTNQDDIANIENISMDIINELYEGYTTADGAMHIDVKASIGVAFCPEHTEDVNELLSFADTAMYFVKKNGKTNYHIYIPEDSATDEYIDPEGF